MTKFFGAIVITMLFLLFTILITNIVSIYTKGDKHYQELINNQVTTVKIDGQEYIYANFHKNVILIPKTIKCSCDTIK